MKALRALLTGRTGTWIRSFSTWRYPSISLTGLVVLPLTQQLLKKIGEAGGLTGLIIFYGAEAIIVGIIVYFALKKNLPDSLDKTQLRRIQVLQRT